MLLLKLANRRSFSMIPTFVSRTAPRIHPLIPRFFSASAAQTQDLKTPDFSIVDYLVSSFGFSPDKAARASKPISYLKSPDKPDAARRFLASQGFSDSDIKTLVKLHSNILCTSPWNLDANIRALRDIGLSHSSLTQIILSGPSALQLSSAAPRIKFWMDFFAGDEASLVKAFKRNRGLINTRGDISEKMSLLQGHGLSTTDIRRILVSVPNFITAGVSTIEDMLKRANELGFQTGSGMFLVALTTVRSFSRETLKKKMELLMSFGWSETDFYSALRKAPRFVVISEKNLRVKMVFFIEEAGCDPSYIASHPTLLPYSLEKRLIPRLHVLKLLESKGISYEGRGLYYAIHLTEKKFVERYILPHKDAISGLHEAYLAACA